MSNIRKFVWLFNVLAVFSVVFCTVFTFFERFLKGFGDPLAKPAQVFEPPRLPAAEELRGPRIPLSGTICPYLEPVFDSLSPQGTGLIEDLSRGRQGTPRGGRSEPRLRSDRSWNRTELGLFDSPRQVPAWRPPNGRRCEGAKRGRPARESPPKVRPPGPLFLYIYK